MNQESLTYRGTWTRIRPSEKFSGLKGMHWGDKDGKPAKGTLKDNILYGLKDGKTCWLVGCRPPPAKMALTESGFCCNQGGLGGGCARSLAAYKPPAPKKNLGKNFASRRFLDGYREAMCSRSGKPLDLS